MSEPEPAVDFNLQQVLKNVQAIELKHLQVEQELITEKSNLEEAKKEYAKTLEKYEEEAFKSSQLIKENSLLEEKIPRIQKSIGEITKQLEEMYFQTEDVKWRQTKAKLVLESERARSKTYQIMMDKRIEQDAPKTEPETSASGSKVSAAKAERALKMEELMKRKESLQKDISKMENAMKEKQKLLSGIDTEASVLKKRNSAKLLRLRRQLQESESRRHQVTTKLAELREMATRAGPRP